MLAVAKISAKGRVTIPRHIRTALGFWPGDLVAWEVAADGAATVRRVLPMDIDHLRAVEGTLGEWVDDADDQAYRGL